MSDLVSKRRVSGLNREGIEDKYKAYGELLEDQISYQWKEDASQITMAYPQICITFKEAMRNQDFTLTCRISTSIANTSSHDEHFLVENKEEDNPLEMVEKD